jgi:hypothetical protein
MDSLLQRRNSLCKSKLSKRKLSLAIGYRRQYYDGHGYLWILGIYDSKRLRMRKRHFVDSRSGAAEPAAKPAAESAAEPASAPTAASEPEAAPTAATESSTSAPATIAAEPTTGAAAAESATGCMHRKRYMQSSTAAGTSATSAPLSGGCSVQHM